MENIQQDVLSQESENIIDGESISAVVDDVMLCCSTVAATRPEKLSDCTGALVTITSGEIPNSDSPNYCENCFSSEPDCHPVTSQSVASCDEKVQSDATSSCVVYSTTASHMENVMPLADSEVNPCAPIVAVGGAREEELKQGLEQRLGLVLSKLAREGDDDHQRWSAQITPDQVVEDSVVDESVSDVESTSYSVGCDDIRHILVMDIVQEMDEVERYSYLSFVAYAMHQLFEYSAWNEYVTFYLLTIQFAVFCATWYLYVT